MKTTFSFVGMVSLVMTAFACGGGEVEVKDPSKDEAKPAETQAAPTPEPAASAAPAVEASKPAPPPPVVEDMKPSEDPKPLPSVKITAPKNDTSVGDLAKAKDFEVKLDVKDWATVEKGPHVHLILDDHPYKPIYDTTKPVKVSELLPQGAELTEGEHTLVAFASRATHESVKGKGAQQLVTFWVGKKGKSTFDPKKPHVVYSRPKGENKGAMARDLLLDFYLFGTTLDKGEKVKYTIASPSLSAPLTGEFTTWAPKVGKNLPKGDYEVTIELVDKDGKPFEGPLTKTTRKGITVDAEAAATDPHGGHGAAPAAAPAAAPEKK